MSEHARVEAALEFLRSVELQLQGAWNVDGLWVRSRLKHTRDILEGQVQVERKCDADCSAPGEHYKILNLEERIAQLEHRERQRQLREFEDRLK